MRLFRHFSRLRNSGHRIAPQVPFPVAPLSQRHFTTLPAEGINVALCQKHLQEVKGLFSEGNRCAQEDFQFKQASDALRAALTKHRCIIQYQPFLPSDMQHDVKQLHQKLCSQLITVLDKSGIDHYQEEIENLRQELDTYQGSMVSSPHKA